MQSSQYFFGADDTLYRFSARNSVALSTAVGYAVVLDKNMWPSINWNIARCTLAIWISFFSHALTTGVLLFYEKAP
jgi:hypothetical protein